MPDTTFYKGNYMGSSYSSQDTPSGAKHFMFQRAWPALFVAVLLFSCATLQPSALTGAWEIDELNIRMNSYKNSSEAKVMSANAANWEDKMKARNIRTYFRADGSYNSVHRNLRDSIVYNPAGTWQVKNDSLVIRDTFPTPMLYTYKFRIENGFAEFWGMEDFDQDGNVDDEYYSRQRKVE